MELDKNGDSVKPDLIQKLRCSVLNYDWGKAGVDSMVARLHNLNSGTQIELESPYAELWMGTHKSGPSYVVVSTSESDGVDLKSWISRNPTVLGRRVLEKWGCDLPFLFKVLSVEKPLSIQAHPDKELARRLHKLLPEVYTDGNHKPEMALAITEFEALSGFITLEELKVVLQNVPEIVELVDKDNANQVLLINEHDGEENVKSALRSIFTQLMSASTDMTTEAITKLERRLYMDSQVRDLTDKEELVLRLRKLYPADIGVISAFFFNYVKLNPGEALCLGANEPHAYLSGECVECMATSDNVVRAGLTPKYRDVPTLCAMLTYKRGMPERLKGFPLSPYITRYLPPFDEFEVDLCVLPSGGSTVFPAVNGPSIFLVTVGEGELNTTGGSVSGIVVVSEGDILFAPADTEIYISTNTSNIQMYRAGINSMFLQTLY